MYERDDIIILWMTQFYSPRNIWNCTQDYKSNRLQTPQGRHEMMTNTKKSPSTHPLLSRADMTMFLQWNELLLSHTYELWILGMHSFL